MDKKSIRKKIRELKSKVSDEELKASSLIAVKKVLKMEQYKNADVIYTYIPTNQEISTYGIIEDALKAGKKVAAPKCFGKTMEFFYFDDVSELERGAYDILEPPEKNPANASNVFMLVPGMAFDYKGNRIGYGGGFYDRYFDSHSNVNIYKCGLCHSFQVLEHIETEEHDHHVDCVVDSISIK